jgi:hypothetical protein
MKGTVRMTGGVVEVSALEAREGERSEPERGAPGMGVRQEVKVLWGP